MRWKIVLEGTDEFGSAHRSELTIDKDLERLSAGEIGFSVEDGKAIDPPPLNWSTLKYVFGRRRRTTMLKKRHKPEEIVAKLRQVEVLTSQGKSVADAIRTIGVTEVTYYRWRQEFGGLKSDQVKRLKNLEAENARLRRAVSDLTLDKMILAEAARGNY